VKKGQKIMSTTRLGKKEVPLFPGHESRKKEWDLELRSQPICYEPDESLTSWFA